MAVDVARKEKLGQKWLCYACGAKFYDLARPEPICPKCQVDQRTAPVVEPPKRAARATAKPAPAKPSRKAQVVDLEPAASRQRPRSSPDEEDDSIEASSDDSEELDVDEGLGDLELDDMQIEGTELDADDAADDSEDEEEDA